MPHPPQYHDEARRMTAVQRLRLVGTPAEERFDKITRLAKRMFNVPISMIDVIGTDSVWIKSGQGCDILEGTTRDSYCYYGVLADHVVYIPDARLDQRTSDNKFAADFVFYAGAPIRSDNQIVGMLCIADTQPRLLTSEQITDLQDYATMAEQEFKFAALNDVTEHLRGVAYVDSLTRCWNRAAIFDIARREIKEALTTGQPMSLLVLDIDHFKAVNDTSGHPGGDEVLRVVAQQLRTALIRPTDAVGRFGGEEFMVVMPHCGRADACLVAERLRLAIESAVVDYEGRRIAVTASLGVAVADGLTSFETVFQKADAALYAAKNAGRNQMQFAASKP